MPPDALNTGGQADRYGRQAAQAENTAQSGNAAASTGRGEKVGEAHDGSFQGRECEVG